MLTTGWFPFQYGWFVSAAYRMSESGVQVLNHNRPGSASRQDSYSIGQDRKCVQKAVETHDRTVTRWLDPRPKYKKKLIQRGSVEYQTC